MNTRERKLLIIDDDIVITRMVQHFFENNGFAVVTCHRAQDGINKAKEFQPDLILLDLEIPEISGHEAALIFRMLPQTKNTPIMMVTGRARDSDRKKSFHMGVDAYITKPFQLDSLLAKVNSLLQTAR